MNEEKVPFTKEQLKSFSKDLLIEMVLSMASQMTEMNKQMALLTERINVMLGDQYGRRTEKSSEIPLFSDHSDPLLSADLCNKLMHDDASFGSF
jgi:hypothetical protein